MSSEKLLLELFEKKEMSQIEWLINSIVFQKKKSNVNEENGTSSIVQFSDRRFNFSNQNHDHNHADTLICVFKNHSKHFNSVNLSHNPKMGDGHWLPLCYSGVQKIMYSMDQGIFITTLDLSRSGVNKYDIDSVEWALEKSPHLKTVYLWEDDLEILTKIFNSNIEQTQGKRKGEILIMKPVAHLDSHLGQNKEDKIRKLAQSGNFKDIPKDDLPHINNNPSALPLEFTYYLGYWHNAYHNNTELMRHYLTYLQQIMSQHAQCYSVFWEGFYNGLRENKNDGKEIQLQLPGLAIDNTFLKNGLDRLFLQQKEPHTLGALQNLTHLNLSGNQINRWGISELLHGLKNTPKLTHLDLSENPLDQHLFGPPSGAKRLSDKLLSLSNLQTLKLAKSGLCPSHITLLADKIQQHPTLTEVDFNSNHIDDDAASLLSTKLLKEKPQGLRKLYLKGNPIEEAGAIQLLHGLNQNSRLTDLKINTSPDILGPIQWKLEKNKNNTPTQPVSVLKKEVIEETQSRLLQWESVSFAWNRYAKAIDEGKIDATQQAILLDYYQKMANQLIAQFLASSVCKISWAEKEPGKAVPNTYYLIKENNEQAWRLYYSGKLPGVSGQEIPCTEVENLLPVLSHFSTKNINDIIKLEPASVTHIIESYHAKHLPDSYGNLKTFYTLLHQDLEKLFMAFFCVGSKIIDTSVSNFIGCLGKIASFIGDALCGADLPKGTESIIQIVGNAFNITNPLFHGIGKGLSSIGTFLQFIDKLQQQNDLHQFSRIGTFNEFKALAQQLALHLTLLYQQQVFALSAKVAGDRTRSTMTHHHPKSPLEAFAEFIVTKIGLRCIAGEAVEDIWTLQNAVTQLSNLAITQQTSKFAEKKEELMMFLFDLRTDTTETDCYPQKRTWELHELCAQTAVFDYVTGQYYTGPLPARRTQIEQFGYVYGREGIHTQDLLPALFIEKLQDVSLFPPLPALFQTFLGNRLIKNSLKLTGEYNPKMIHYFMDQLDNCSQCIRVAFDLSKGPGNALEKFKKSIQQLVILSNRLKYPAVFISPIPNQAGYFLCGLIHDQAVLLINPAGKTQYTDDFYSIFNQLQEINWLGFTNTWLHKSNVYRKITTTSSLPITLELIRYFVSYNTLETFKNIFNALKIKNSNAYEVNLSEVLISYPRLHQLDKEKNEFSYQQTMIEIRQSHYELLQKWFFNPTPVTTEESKKQTASPDKSEKSKAQMVFDNLMGDISIEQLLELSCYTGLQKDLEISVNPSQIEQIKSLEDRILALEEKLKNLTNDNKNTTAPNPMVNNNQPTNNAPPENLTRTIHSSPISQNTQQSNNPSNTNTADSNTAGGQSSEPSLKN